MIAIRKDAETSPSQWEEEKDVGKYLVTKDYIRDTGIYRVCKKLVPCLVPAVKDGTFLFTACVLLTSACRAFRGRVSSYI